MAADNNIYSMRDDNRYVEEATEASPLLDNTSRSLPTSSEPTSSSFYHDNDLTEIADESRYEEVAANSSNRDDPSRDPPVRSDWVPVGLGASRTGYPVRLGDRSDWYSVRLRLFYL